MKMRLMLYRLPTSAAGRSVSFTNGLVCSQRVYGDSLQRATLEGVEYTNYPHDAGVIGFVDRS